MRRKVGLFVACALVLSLAVAPSVSGQGSVLQVDDQTPAPGQAIRVTGTSFSNAAGRSPVRIRLNARDGQVLAETTANQLSQIDTTFPLPNNLQPGWYLLVATQTVDANGRQQSFTPGRTRIRVTGSSRGAAAPPGGGGGGSSGLPLVLRAGALALIVLAGGA